MDGMMLDGIQLLPQLGAKSVGGNIYSNNGSNIIKPWALAHGFMILEPLFKQNKTI